jgi:hypothetical protein
LVVAVAVSARMPRLMQMVSLAAQVVVHHFQVALLALELRIKGLLVAQESIKKPQVAAVVLVQLV